MAIVIWSYIPINAKHVYIGTFHILSQLILKFWIYRET